MKTRRDTRELLAGQGDFIRPSRREIGWLLVAGSAILSLSMAALGPQWRRIGLIGEWATYMTFALVILAWRPFRSALAQTRRLEVAAVVASLLLMALGQFVGGGRHTYPLVRFQMFTDATSSEVHQYHYLGITNTGERLSLRPVQLFPSLDQGRLDGKLVQSLDLAIRNGPGSDAAKNYDALLLALVKRHNLSAPNKIIRLDVYDVDARLDPPPRKRVDVEGVRVWSVEPQQ